MREPQNLGQFESLSCTLCCVHASMSCTQDLHVASMSGLCTQDLHIASMSGLCTQDLHIASMSGLCTQDLHIASMSGLYTRPARMRTYTPLSPCPFHVCMVPSPGTKLSSLRLVIEREMIARCGECSTLQGRYQVPLRGLSVTQHHPPLFAKNVERPIGSARVGPCQLSLVSLLPIMLHSETNIGKRSSASSRLVDVDIDSCVLSIQDLIAHWLTQPIHTLVLTQALRMVVMISDLFSLPSQFEWMLMTFLGVVENHPTEDTVCQALLVLGILKSAAVMQVGGRPPSLPLNLPPICSSLHTPFHMCHLHLSLCLPLSLSLSPSLSLSVSLSLFLSLSLPLSLSLSLSLLPCPTFTLFFHSL